MPEPLTERHELDALLLCEYIGGVREGLYHAPGDYVRVLQTGSPKLFKRYAVDIRLRKDL